MKHPLTPPPSPPRKRVSDMPRASGATGSVTRGRKRRFGRKGRKPRKIPASVKAYVKERLWDSADTKKFSYATNILLREGELHVHNPFFQIVPGIAQSTRIGDRIKDAVLRVDYRYYHIGAEAVTANNDWLGSQMRMLLIRSNVKTGTIAGTRFAINPAGLTATQVFEAGAHVGFASVDTDQVTVKKDIKVSSYKSAINQGPAGTIRSFGLGVPTTGTVYFRLAPNWTYQGLATTDFGLLREMYLVIGADMLNAPALSNVGHVQLTMTTMWKDG